MPSALRLKRKVTVAAVRSPVTGNPALACSIENKRENIRFVLLIKLESFMTDEMREYHIGRTGYLFIVDQHAVVVAHPDQKQMLSNFAKTEFGKIF